MNTLAVPSEFSAYPRSMSAGRLSLLEKFLLFVYFFSFSFDFRSEGAGGQPIHYVFLALSEISFFAFFAASMARRKVRDVYEFNRLPIYLLIAITLYSPVMAAIREIPPSTFLPLELRYVLLTQSVLLVFLVARIGDGFDYILKLILFSAIVALIWNLYYVFEILEMEAHYVRYRISPGYIIGLIAIGFGVFWGANPIYVLPLLGAIILIQISATRTQLAMMVVAFLMLNIAALVSRRRQAILAFLCVDIAAMPLVFFLYSRGAFENWIQRFASSETGVGQATWLSRLAEYLSQWEILTSSWSNVVFGAGLGATFFRDLTVMRYAVLSGHFGVDDFADQSLGHSLYFYSVFSGGALVGWIIPLLVLSGVVYSMRNLLRSARQRLRKRMILDAQCHAYLVMIAAAGLLSHPFSNRLLCLHAGAILAITFIYPRIQDRSVEEVGTRGG